MADSNLINLASDTSPSSTDLLYSVKDPSGSPSNRKVTHANVITKAHGLSDGTVKVTSGVMTTVVDTLGYVAKTANYTATSSDTIIDCTTNTFTITLPTAVGITGKMYIVKNSGTGVITIATTSSQTIDGATTYDLGTQYMSLTVVSNNANWIVV